MSWHNTLPSPGKRPMLSVTIVHRWSTGEKMGPSPTPTQPPCSFDRLLLYDATIDATISTTSTSAATTIAWPTMPAESGTCLIKLFSHISTLATYPQKLPWKLTEQADELRRGILAMSEEITQGISPGQIIAASTMWRQWTTFCHELGWEPGLSHTDDPTSPAFTSLVDDGRMARWHDGRIAPLGKPTCARTAEDVPYAT
jgi:hypothetical protein